MLEESDKEQAKELERKAKKAARKVNQARTRMGAGKSQPGIGAMFKSAKVKPNLSTTVQGSGVVTSIDESSLEVVPDDEMQDDAHTVVESQTAHCLVEGMCQGAHSMEGVQEDVQKVVECKTHSLEDVKEQEGGGKEGDSVPAELSRSGWKISQGRWLSGVSVSRKDKDIPKSNSNSVSVACLSNMGVARLQDMNKHEEMCTVDHIGQSEAEKNVCRVCTVSSVQCVQCVRVDGAERIMIGQTEVSRQMFIKSRKKEITQGGGNSLHSFGGGGQSSLRTFTHISSLEKKKKGRGEPSGKYASVTETDNINKISTIIQQFGGPKKGGEKETISLGNLTPTKRKLIQNKNTKILLNNFENVPEEFNPECGSESPAKKRRYTVSGGGQ